MAETALTGWVSEHFAQPWLLALALALPLLWLLWLGGNLRRRRDLRLWLGEQPLLRLPRRRVGRLALWCAAACLIVVSAEPLWGTNPHVAAITGRDLFVVLDVSRSMLAEDRPPLSRLERAKARLKELIDHLQSRGGGHRVGIILFAGQARLLCPLTADYDHLRYALGQAHPDLLGPNIRLSPHEPQVGTSFRPAVELALRQPALENRPDMVFLFMTDGDDLANEANAAALQMHASHLPWHLYGVGDPDKPAPIPSGNSDAPFIMIDDPSSPTPQRATTLRRDMLLKQMATTARAMLLLEDAAPLSLVTWWKSEVERGLTPPWFSDPRIVHVHQYAWFMAAALVLLVGELFWGEGCFRSRSGPLP